MNKKSLCSDTFRFTTEASGVADQLIRYFNRYISFNKEEKEDVSRRIIEKNRERRQFILHEYDVYRHYTFEVSGLFKMYAAGKNGGAHNFQFAAEND